MQFSGAVNNPVSMFAVSFTGSSGAGLLQRMEQVPHQIVKHYRSAQALVYMQQVFQTMPSQVLT